MAVDGDESVDHVGDQRHDRQIDQSTEKRPRSTTPTKRHGDGTMPRRAFTRGHIDPLQLARTLCRVESERRKVKALPRSNGAPGEHPTLQPPRT